jgi:eukaryotic-like serine/threonine-protein kinase
MWSLGMTLGQRYELEERVGAGGYSEVWRGRDLVLNRPVAVKLLHAGYVQDGEALARFRAEARHAGSLAHENIARVYDYGEPDPPYLVMELVDGPTLAGELAGGPVDPARVMDLIAQAAAGLQAAHSAGLVHRDIKPGNLLLAPGDVVKVTDFGIAHAVGSAPVTSTGQVIGTPGYLAPERMGGASATAASDLYSLGVVAYECLTGVPPFTGTALDVALAHASRPFPYLPGSVPPHVAALVMQLTAKDPAERPASADEVAARARLLGDRLKSGPSCTSSRPDDMPAGEPETRAQHAAPLPWWTSSRLSAGAALAGVAVALTAVVALSGGSTASPEPAVRPAVTPSTRPSTPAPRSAVAVDVNAPSLIGQPVSAVVRQLRQQNVTPRVVWQPTTAQQPGRVTAILPGGQLTAGSIVTVVGALAVPASASTTESVADPLGNGKGKGGGKGKDNGKGNAGGHGNGNG